MAKTREIVCAFYEYEGGICAKRNCECRFNKEMQTCQKYEKLSGAKPRRVNKKRELKYKGEKENE